MIHEHHDNFRTVFKSTAYATKKRSNLRAICHRRANLAKARLQRGMPMTLRQLAREFHEGIV